MVQGRESDLLVIFAPILDDFQKQHGGNAGPLRGQFQNAPEQSFERLSRFGVGGRELLQRNQQRSKKLFERCLIQFFLALEVVINHPLRYAGPQRDFFGTRAVEAVSRKFFFRRRQDSGARQFPIAPVRIWAQRAGVQCERA